MAYSYGNYQAATLAELADLYIDDYKLSDRPDFYPDELYRDVGGIVNANEDECKEFATELQSAWQHKRLVSSYEEPTQARGRI